MSSKSDFDRYAFRTYKILGAGWIVVVAVLAYYAFRPKPQPPGGAAIGS